VTALSCYYFLLHLFYGFVVVVVVVVVVVFVAAMFVCVCFFCSLSGAPHQLLLQLPVYFTKFMEPSIMGSTDFFTRWKQLFR